MYSQIKNISIACAVLIALGGLFQNAAAASEEEIRAAMAGFVDAINAHDVAQMSSYWTDDIVYDFVAQPPALNGKQEVTAFFEGLFRGIPDFHGIQTCILVSDNIMVTEAMATGTHLGELSGIPGTGSSLQIFALHIWEFEDNKIKRATEYLDVASTLIQIGLMPAPELDPALLVPSFLLPEAEPTGLTPLDAAAELDALWDAHDLAGCAKGIHPEAEILMIPFGIPIDRQGFIAISELEFLGFSDMRWEPVRSIDMGDGWVVTEIMNTGTNDGPYMGIPATRRSIALRGGVLRRFDMDGLLTNLHCYYDNLSLLAQLGLFPPPDPEANKAIGKRIFDEIWNEGNLDVADEVLASDLIRYDSGNPSVSGPVGSEGFKQLVSAYRSAFPDIHWTVEDLIAEDDFVTIRWTATGTHQGEFIGIPPTGASVTGTGMSILRIENGKVKEEWADWDSMAMMEQLGVISPTRVKYSWGAPSEAAGDPGDPAANTALVLYFVQKFWNEQNVAGSDYTHSLDFLAHNPVIPGQPLPYDMYKHVCLLHLAAFPDFRVTTEKIITEDDKVVVRWTVNGTHLGQLMGIPATGRQVKFTGITIYRFADGKIVENWWAYDALGMMQQITMPPESDPGQQ